MNSMKKIFIFLWIILSFIFSTNQTLWYWCSEYWTFAYESSPWYCSCMSWYKMDNLLWNKYCVSNATYCYDNYWFNSKYSYSQNTCVCRDWYYPWTNTFWDTTCIKEPSCSDTYGLMAFENLNWTCSCRSWYVFWKDVLWNKSCVNWNNFCTDTQGLYSSYSYISKTCECDNWYTLKDWKCEEKHNSAYFYLSEYDDNEYKALVISYTTKNKYLLELKYTSWLYKAESFVWKDIVINMWTDFYIDKYDKFILNNQAKTTDIVSDILYIEQVDNSYTLSENGDSDINTVYNSEDTMSYRDVQMNKYYNLYKDVLEDKLENVDKDKLIAINEKILTMINTYESDNSLSSTEKDEKIWLYLGIYLIINEIIQE